MRKPSPHQRAVHRLAFVTACVALLPIAVGALVTSMQAGMAFRDWPDSDGHFVLTYPWLADLLRGAKDKFVEHGHRLAGMLIGLTSIALVLVTWRRESRRWVRLLAAGVLGGVVVQGLLGGGRVLADDPRLAMVHGNFAAIVFCLMGTLTLVTSRCWVQAASSGQPERQRGERAAAERDLPAQGDLRFSLTLKVLAVAAPLVVYVQFILGGRQRHLHDMLHEHLAGAVASGLVVLVFAGAAWRTGVRWLRRLAPVLVLVLLLQLGLGAGAWVTKFGFPPAGYVAVHGAPLQLILRSGHTVVGMLLLMTSVVLSGRVLRLTAVGTQRAPESLPTVSVGSLSTEGGSG